MNHTIRYPRKHNESDDHRQYCAVEIAADERAKRHGDEGLERADNGGTDASQMSQGFHGQRILIA